MADSMKMFQWAAVVLTASLFGCTVHPPGESEERAAAARAGARFEKPLESRPIAPLPESPTPDDLVTYALLNNADLEQHYWAWRAAIEQIPQDGTQTATLNVGAGTTITRGRAGWGSSTLALSNDPMTDIKWPGKLDAAAAQSLENARATGRRFLKAKYDLRAKVLGAYDDYALTAELIRLEQRNAQLLDITVSTTTARSRTGGAGQQDVSKASNEVDLSRNSIANMQSQQISQRAALNALLNRPADAPLPAPANLPPARAVTLSDAELADRAATHNPELAALADEIRGRRDGIRLARLQYVPDFNFSAGSDLTGIAQSILGQVTVPIFSYEALNAAVAQAEANLYASEATARQGSHDLRAQVVLDITTLRDVDRQMDLFDRTILPRARYIVSIGRAAYETGRMSLLELLDNQRSLVALERLLATLRVTREKSLIDLERIAATELK